MFTIGLYGITAVLVGISLVKSPKRTLSALRKAWKSFENILPQFMSIILIVGVLLAVFDTKTIVTIIGERSGVIGVVISALVGAITLVPGFIAFPAAALLLQGGAGVMQIATFVSTLMMVGVVTAPVEVKYFGVKLTVLRNTLAFVFSFLIGFVVYLAVTRL